MKSQKNVQVRTTQRYGAAELYGQAINSLTPIEMKQLVTSKARSIACPFKANAVMCNKAGGVCSLTLYERSSSGAVQITGLPVTTCPSRFLEAGTVFRWVGETLLDTSNPKVVSEVPFLMSETRVETGGEAEVGRIDNVLVNPAADTIHWCALEMQAVYFSGAKMEGDFALMRNWDGVEPVFPQKHRRPDYRSSGPKRLMPQLQIKVPTLRRWGKKMAVVVDNAFWNSLGEMRRTGHITNADIVWFVVDYEGPQKGRYHLIRRETVFTTLENAVEGLTGGTPVSLEQFEHAIRRKLERSEAK